MRPSPDSSPPPSERPPDAPTEAVAFLVRLSIALHKHSSYPPGHPTLAAADTAALEALQPLLERRDALTVAIARDTFHVEGAETDPAHPVLRELAERLHRRQIGAFIFRGGVDVAELSTALQEIAGDSQRVRQRVVAEEGAEPLLFPHIDVLAHNYRRLALAHTAEEQAESEAISPERRLWLELVSTIGAAGEELQDPAALASALNARAKTEGESARIADLLLALGREAREASGEERRLRESELRGLLDGLSPETVSWLFGGAGAAPDRFADAIESMPADGVLVLVQSAAEGAKQNISNYMLRLLQKMARHSSTTVSEASVDAELRESARTLVENWSLEDPNPGVHARILDHLARLEPTVSSEATVDGAGPLRLIQIGLETGCASEDVLSALDELLAARRLAEVLDLLGAEQDGSALALRAHLERPDAVRSVLLEEPVDLAAAERYLSTLGTAAAGPMLDALAISESQDTRRVILARLVQLGDDIAEQLTERLPNVPWYVQRNLLALLVRCRRLPTDFSARRWAEHTEVSVRYPALQIMLRSSTDREDGVHRALGDPDARIVRLGLEAAQRGLPRQAVTRVLMLAGTASRPIDLRTRAIELLQQVNAPMARDWLLARVLAKRTLLRGERLHPKSPEALAALRVLAITWPTDPKAQRAIQLAAQSGDAEVVAAVTRVEEAE